MIRFLYPAALAVLVLLVACSGNAADQGSPTLTASPTPGVSPLAPTPSVTVPPDPPEVLAGVTIGVLRVGEDLEFPFNHSIVTLLGCTNCDGPAYGIGRIYRDATSRVVVEPLMWANNSIRSINVPENSLGLPEENSYAIIGAAADATGSEIIAGVWGTGDKTTLFRSTDGGVTWVNYLEMAGAHSPRLIVELGRVLVGPYAFGGQVPYQIVPNGGVIEPPEGGGSPALVDGEIVWDRDATRQDGPGLVSIHQDRHPRAAYYVAEREGVGPVTRAYFSPDARVGDGFPLADHQYLTVAPFLQDSDRAAGQPYSGGFLHPLIPTIVDMETGEVHSIADTWEGSQALSARGVLSLRTGSFALVTGTGSCLNVRAEPSVSAEILACAADNVLLTIVEPHQPGPDWLHVITPGGVEGFVSRDYVEVIG